MQEVIREGALRLLLTAETSCDVIISCKGYRLMAHRVMLSIASPVLQDLLLQDTSQPTVLIFPEISSSTMSLVLDYIYSGSVSITSTILPDFLSIARELGLRLDLDCLKKDDNETLNYSTEYKKIEIDFSRGGVDQLKEENNAGNYEGRSNLIEGRALRKTLRKVPNLMPISSFRSRKELYYNRVIPSPWCPRVSPLLADPRQDFMGLTDLPEYGKSGEKMLNDSNNNFQIVPAVPFSPQNECGTKKFHLPSSSISIVTRAEPEKIGEQIQESKFKKCKIDGESENFKSRQETVVANAEVGRSERNVEESESDRRKPFVCKDCGKSFSQLRNFKYHRSVHEGTKEFAARCTECGKTFNDKGYLSSHMKIHRDRKEYGCPHCPKRFNQRVAYNMHLRIHTGIKPHECPTCGKTFSRKMLLKQHQRVHTGERPYACPECGKSFADRSNMSLHARLHTGVKPYECDLCSKCFTKKHHLKTHMNFHTGLKPYSCQKCGITFSQSSNMRTHYKKCILKSTDVSEPDVR